MVANYIIDRLIKIEGTNFDRRRKLSVQDVDRIRELHNNGVSISRLADIYNVSYLTIKYHVDDDFKERENQRRNYYKQTPVDQKVMFKNRIAYKRSLLNSIN